MYSESGDMETEDIKPTQICHFSCIFLSSPKPFLFMHFFVCLAKERLNLRMFSVNAISTALHSVFTHLKPHQIDVCHVSSAFNTISTQSHPPTCFVQFFSTSTKELKLYIFLFLNHLCKMLVILTMHNFTSHFRSHIYCLCPRWHTQPWYSHTFVSLYAETSGISQRLSCVCVEFDQSIREKPLQEKSKHTETLFM